jgi:hypothetical protein
LARAELSEKVREAGSGLALLAAGGMIILIGLFFIVQAAVFGFVALLDIWLPPEVAVWLGPLLVGLAAVLIGWALLSSGRRKLSAETLALHRTAHALREDTALAREHLPQIRRSSAFGRRPPSLWRPAQLSQIRAGRVGRL